MEIASLFSGCGGMDLGFAQAGFSIIWANEIDRNVTSTYARNHTDTELVVASIRDIPSGRIPDVDGIIGGPPCQSWSLAGRMRGAQDDRGALFFEYLRVINDKKPLFFVAENVKGLVSRTHWGTFSRLVSLLEGVGYRVTWKVLNAKHYGVPQDRERVFIVGTRRDLGIEFQFPPPSHGEQTDPAVIRGLVPDVLPVVSLRDAISDLPEPVPVRRRDKCPTSSTIMNHEYLVESFSPRYLSRNRRRGWDEPSFTIQASGRHCPLHPSSPPMYRVEKDWFEFQPPGVEAARRLSVRECARIQTFPDSFEFVYERIEIGYRMVGNAVPVLLAQAVAEAISRAIGIQRVVQPYEGMKTQTDRPAPFRKSIRDLAVRR